MLILEIIIITILTIFQSIFGIGLLLFGTPIFLYLNYTFVDALFILLPVSISISAMQFCFSANKDYNFVNKINKFCLPLVILFLSLTIFFYEYINFKYWISILLIISSFIILMKEKFISYLKKIENYEHFILAIIGIIHGFTNMGGSFLSLFASYKSSNSKNLTRQYIAYGYLSMGICQYIVLFILNSNSFNYQNLCFLLISAILFLPSQKLFHFIHYAIYIKLLGLLALLFGFFVLFSFYI